MSFSPSPRGSAMFDIASGTDTALDQLDLLAHPSRSIQVALAKPTRSRNALGTATHHSAGARGRPRSRGEEAGRRFHLESGALACSMLLHAQSLVGGIAVLTEALGAASSKGVDADRLTKLRARAVVGASASTTDPVPSPIRCTLPRPGRSAGTSLTSRACDIDLEPGHEASSYRDARSGGFAGITRRRSFRTSCTSRRRRARSAKIA